MVGLFGFFAMVETDAEVCEEFPFECGFTICDVLGFEVGYLSTEDGPDAEILALRYQI